MKDSGRVVASSPELEIEEHISIIDHIIQLKRDRDTPLPPDAITKEERDVVLKRALNTYKLLNEKSRQSEGKILIEYRKGLHKIVEEVIL